MDEWINELINECLINEKNCAVAVNLWQLYWPSAYLNEWVNGGTNALINALINEKNYVDAAVNLWQLLTQRTAKWMNEWMNEIIP